MKRALVLISAVVLSLCLSSCVVSKRETETAPRQDESIETKQASGQDKSVLIDEMPIEMESGNDMVEHPHNQQMQAKTWMDKYRIQHEAWAPFGEGRNGLFDDPILTEIGGKYGKTTAQVMLRWHIQRNTVVIPKSVHYERMLQNINVFDFKLTDEDMNRIATLDKQESSFFSHYDPKMVECTDGVVTPGSILNTEQRTFWTI